MKSRRIRWTGYVARMGVEVDKKRQSGNQMEREDLDIDGRVIFLEK
jgi:hypothetical protein